MSLRTPIVAATAAVLLGLGSAASAQNLLANPGFESPQLNGGDSATVDGFTKTSTGGGVFTLDINYFNTGEQSVKIFGNGGAFQTFNASAGQTYNGSVTAINPANDALGGDSEGQLQVNFLDMNNNVLSSNVVSVATAATPQTGAASPFRSFSTGDVISPAGTTQVQYLIRSGAFNDINGDGTIVNGGGSTYFDDASLQLSTSVPEPTSLGLLAAGGLLLARRRAH